MSDLDTEDAFDKVLSELLDATKKVGASDGIIEFYKSRVDNAEQNMKDLRAGLADVGRKEARYETDVLPKLKELYEAADVLSRETLAIIGDAGGLAEKLRPLQSRVDKALVAAKAHCAADLPF